jgi:hypothetical protein
VHDLPYNYYYASVYKNGINSNLLHQNRNVMHNELMRTTVNLNDDTHEFVSYYAHARGISLSAAIDELIRKAQAGPELPSAEILYSPNGLPMFPPTGRTITAEMVKQLEEEEFDPEKFA